MDIDAFRQMVAKHPKGFLGREPDRRHTVGPDPRCLALRPRARLSLVGTKGRGEARPASRHRRRTLRSIERRGRPGP